MTTARGITDAVRLGDGTVIVLGNEDEVSTCVRPDSATTEIWSPATGTWTPGPRLNAPRAEFAAVGVADGDVLVTGGVTAGVTSDVFSNGHLSYSSTYVYDPTKAAAGWSRQGLLAQARTLPTAATLHDGRVLVAGGYYLAGGLLGDIQPSGGGLVGYRAGGGGRLAPGGPTLQDVSPPRSVPALATAELFDPATGTWSVTGPLRYARVGAPAVTLDDGRVLVVGSGGGRWTMWNYAVPAEDPRASATAEVFDPRAGRFSLTGDLPAVDWSPLAATFGPYPIEGGGGPGGTLVALPDGGALLVGEVAGWRMQALDLEGITVRTMRFDAATNRWSLVDERVVAIPDSNGPTPTQVVVPGYTREGAIAVRLADGRVLIAGGHADDVADSWDLQGMADAAGVYDPATNAISSVSRMPDGRSGAAAMLLADGSVLVTGGEGAKSACEGDCPCETAATGLATAVRFVPGP